MCNQISREKQRYHCHIKLYEIQSALWTIMSQTQMFTEQINQGIITKTLADIILLKVTGN
jgi:hypothetical protein